MHELDAEGVLPSLSLTTVLLGSGLSCAILCYVMAQLRRLPDAPAAFGWWSLAFALGTLRFIWRSLQPWIGLPPALFGAEALQASAAVLLLVGVGRLIGFHPGRLVLAGAIGVVVAWAAIFVFVRFDLVLLSVPLHFLAGGALVATSVTLFREHRRRAVLNLNLAVPPFALWGLVEFLYPLTLANPILVPWYFLLTQGLAVIIAVCLVVGALRRFQFETRRAEDRLVAAVETMPAQIALFDADGNLIRGNAAYHADYGASGSRAPEPSLRFEDLMERLSRHRSPRLVEAGDAQSASPTGPDSVEFEAVLPDGRTFTVRRATTPDRGSILVAVDISAQMERERELLQSARLLRGTLDVVKIGIAVFATDGAVVARSKRFVEAIELGESPVTKEMTFDSLLGVLARRGDLGAGAPWDLASRAIAKSSGPGGEIPLALPSGRPAKLICHPVDGGGMVVCALPDAQPLISGNDAKRQMDEGS